MAIIVSRDGKNAQRVDPTPIVAEDYLQNYIHQNPEAIPVTELKQNMKLLILAREFPTESGPIDALGVDSDGDIYVVETKLYKNPDKRLVIAQMLDYGAALWKGYQDFAEFTAQVESTGGEKLKTGLTRTLAEFFGLDEQALENVLQNMRSSINDGRFQFIVLMNHLEDRLKTLISFVNSSSNFRVLGCELEFYEHKGFEILIPRLYGAESKPRVANSGSTTRRKWTREMYNAELARTEPTERANRIRALISLAEQHPDLFLAPKVGTGLTGSLSFYDLQEYRIFTAYLNGKCEISRPDPEKVRAAVVRQLIAKHSDNLHWRSEFQGEDLYGDPSLMPIEELTAEAFDALKAFLMEFASLRSGS
jgi:hypothetical protein